MVAARRIPTYFSHSYRLEDRALNEFFWREFEAHDFGFTVDPRTNPLSTCHLESMMRRSACFVAVVPLRPEQLGYKCSPFIVHEYGLAVRAQKPRALFIEKGVPGHLFPNVAERFVFDRDELASYDFRGPIQGLAAKSRGYAAIGDRLVGEVGIALPDTEHYRRAMPEIKRALKDAGHAAVPVALDFTDPADLAFELDRFDFVIIDVADERMPQWLFPMLFGRFVPTINLIHHDPAGGLSPNIPDLVAGETLRHATSARELVLWWSDPDELATQLQQQVNRFSLPRTQFQSLDEGVGYFQSIGRTAGGVFVSNSGPDDQLAREIGRSLKLFNFTFFHYRYNNTIPLGIEWSDRLDRLVQESRVFVPLLSEHYWKSEWCRQEYATAERLSREGKLTIIPYFLDDSAGDDVRYQGVTLTGQDDREKVDRILRDLDDFFTKSPVELASAAPKGDPAPPKEEWHDWRPDIAIISILKEEYDAILRHLESPQLVPASHEHPNIHAWRRGVITGSGQSYRVLLGLAQTGQGGAMLATKNAIERFRPDTVLVVGIAGGIADGMRKGDVAVSDRILGYEYGRADGGFQPRDDWNYRSDQGIAAMAMTLSDAWRAEIRTAPPEPDAASRVFVGPIASGSKLVDDRADPTFGPVLQRWPKLIAVEMEALGAVEAVEEARHRGITVGFATVRGISDLPPVGQAKPDGAVNGRSPQTQERDAWKTFAADAAATLTAHLIKNTWPYPPRP